MIRILRILDGHGCLAVIMFAIAIIAMLIAVITPKFEAEAYKRATGKNVSY